MSTLKLTSAEIRDVIVHATTGANRATLEATPAVAWLLPRLEAERDRIGELLAGAPPDELIANLRAEATAGDALADDTYRHLFYLLTAGLYVGEAAARAAVQRALDALFPDRLSVVNLSWRKAAVASHVFAQRLEREDVQAGLEAAGEYVKRVRDVAGRCVRAGSELGEVLARLDAAEAAAAAKPRERELLDARRRALSTWLLFVDNLEFALDAADPEQAIARERLLHRWRLFARPASPAGASTPDADPVDTPAPAPQPEPEQA